jgi:hypothetical protein
MGRRLLIGLLVGVVAALVGAATASAADSVFWSNWQGANLGRAALTGGGSDLTPTPEPAKEPYGSAIDAATGKIYWGDTATDTIRYANLDGSGSAVLATGGATVDQPNSTAVDLLAGRVYWANAFDNTIGWANLDGSGGGGVPTGTAPIQTPYGIAVDPAGNRVYWANYQGAPSIGYANLDGSGGGELAVPAGLLSGPDGLAIDSTTRRIYFTNYETSNIGWAGLDGVGGGILPIAPEAIEGPTGLTIDSTADRVYWANEEGDSIGSALLDGSGAALLGTTGATPNFPSFPSLLKAPESDAAPTLSGASSVGSTLTCKPGTWAADSVGSQLYRAPQSTATAWTLNGSTLNGATGSTLTATQSGAYACQSIATNGAGSTTATSATTNVVGTSAAATTPPPATSVSLLRVKFDKRHGTATVLAKVSGPGILTMTGKKVVRRSVKASGAGIAKLKVASKGGALKTLIKAGEVKVRITVRFLATEGARASATRKLTLHRLGDGRGTP